MAATSTQLRETPTSGWQRLRRSVSSFFCCRERNAIQSDQRHSQQQRHRGTRTRSQELRDPLLQNNRSLRPSPSSTSLIRGILRYQEMTFFIADPNADLPTPLVAFYAPQDCFKALTDCVDRMIRATAGHMYSSARDSRSQYAFELLTCNTESSNYTMTVSIGWPDTSGGNILLPPVINQTDRVLIFQRQLVLSMTRCVVITVARLHRVQLRSLQQILQCNLPHTFKVVIYHVVQSPQEFEVQRDLIDHSVSTNSCSAVVHTRTPEDTISKVKDIMKELTRECLKTDFLADCQSFKLRKAFTWNAQKAAGHANVTIVPSVGDGDSDWITVT